MSEFDTFGITLPVRDWRALLDLSRLADRSPSDCLRLLIRQEADRVHKDQHDAQPTRTSGASDEQSTAVLYQTQLHQKINQYFDDDDLQTVCFNLGVEYDNLKGDTKSGKARELILWCKKHSCLDKLTELLRKERPKVPW